jgi:hypothetical protein
MKAIHRTVYFKMSAGGSGELHTQNYLLRVDNEVELMRRIDARFPNFNEGRE